MYAAKQGGRGRFQLFDTSLREASARRVEIVSALHRALELEEIELLMQPIVDLADGRLAGVEALLRWRRGGVVVPPLEFVPLAEEAGLIAEIERFALAEACRMGLELSALHRRARRGQRQRLAAPRAAGRPAPRASSTPSAARASTRAACSWS